MSTLLSWHDELGGAIAFPSGDRPAEGTGRSEQALLLPMVEMVGNGVSALKCGTELCQSTVSELYQGLDGVVQEWNERDPSGHQ